MKSSFKAPKKIYWYCIGKAETVKDRIKIEYDLADFLGVLTKNWMEIELK